MRRVQAHNAHHRQAVTEDSLIDRLLDQDTTFAAFRLPGQEVQLYLQRDKELRSPHSGEDLAQEREHRSAGNPYIALELLRGLRESGVITMPLGAENFPGP